MVERPLKWVLYAMKRTFFTRKSNPFSKQRIHTFFSKTIFLRYIMQLSIWNITSVLKRKKRYILYLGAQLTNCFSMTSTNLFLAWILGCSQIIGWEFAKIGSNLWLLAIYEKALLGSWTRFGIYLNYISFILFVIIAY